MHETRQAGRCQINADNRLTRNVRRPCIRPYLSGSLIVEVLSVYQPKFSRLTFGLLLVLALVASVLTLSATRGQAAPPAAPTFTEAGVRDLVSAETGLSFSLYTPQIHISAEGNLTAPGLTARLDEPGAPAIPYYSTLIALPPGAEAAITITPDNITRHTLTTPITAAAQVADRAGLDDALEKGLPISSLDQFGLAYPQAPHIYTADANYPAALYDLSAPMILRDLRVVRLSLYPLRYNPVQGQLQQAGRLQVALQFSGATANPAPRVVGRDADLTASLDKLVLNPAQARAWHSRPVSLQSLGTTFPLGVPTFKIEVNQDGIYDVTYADLVQAGMDVNGVDPHHFALSYRGQPVSYQFIGNGNNFFEAGEAIRFYGWAFRGSRLEAQYITHNIYWLWLDPAAASVIPVGVNPAGVSNLDGTRMTVNDDPDVLYFSSFTDQWQDAPNEPDAWYWARMQQTVGCNGISPCPTPHIKTVTVDLPHPILDSPDAANVLVEVMGRGITDHNVQVDVNNVPAVATLQFYGKVDANAEGVMAASDLLTGANTFKVILQSNLSDYIYLNRISVNYPRYLIADNNQLIFPINSNGLRNLMVSGFTDNNVNNVIVWNVTDPYHPVRIPLSAADITGSGPYQYRIGANLNGSAEFIATTTANVLDPLAISKYVAVNLEPANNGAEWIAVSHASLLANAQDLADYRAARDHLLTHVINVEDVMNQYGYGLWLPSALQTYLRHGMADWAIPPKFVVLVGDSTINPRNLPSLLPPGSTTPWVATEPQLVPTALEFVDRSQGQVPTDHVYATLVGDDDLPDLAVGRLPAQTTVEAAGMVQKIILYEAAFTAKEAWMSDMLFVADDSDSGGEFCYDNQVTIAEHVSADYHINELCLPVGYTQDDLNALRAALFSGVNAGVAILNYRGHGSVQVWSNIMTVLDTPAWFNDGRPTFILSADCLDGFFAWPGWPGLGETYFKLNGTGSAGHWSSSGLGYTDEHSVLHRAYYDGMFLQKLTTTGEAAVYAKTVYLTGGGHRSEGFSFTLLGDPAMQIAVGKTHIYLPTSMNHTTIGK